MTGKTKTEKENKAHCNIETKKDEQHKPNQ